KFLTFTIVGLSTGAIYAIIASGLVLTYTTTGIFNFAQGAIGMVCDVGLTQRRKDAKEGQKVQISNNSSFAPWRLCVR
ncbi:MAG: hypothetical protein ACKO2P_10530, partial [Planctomycetota bacterium]